MGMDNRTSKNLADERDILLPDCPDVVTACIISFTGHPLEPDFNMLENLSRNSKMAVQRFKKMMSPDPLLLVKHSKKRYRGAWYFTKKSNLGPEVDQLLKTIIGPGSDSEPEEHNSAEEIKKHRASMAGVMYTFTREDAQLDLSVLSYDKHISKGGEITLRYTDLRTGEERMLGTFRLKNELPVVGKFYATYMPQGRAKVNEIEVFTHDGVMDAFYSMGEDDPRNNMQYQEAHQQAVQHGLLPDISLDNVNELKFGKPDISIRILWPGHEGELL